MRRVIVELDARDTAKYQLCVFSPNKPSQEVHSRTKWLDTDLVLWRQENLSECILVCSLPLCKFPFSNKTLSGSTSAHRVVRHGLSVLRICALTSMKWGASDQKYITRSFQNLKVRVLSFGTILPPKQNLMCGGAGYGSHSLLEAMILNRGACRPSSFEQAAVQRLNRKETHHHSDAFPLHSSVKKSTSWIVAIIIMTGSPNLRLFWELRGSRGAVIR